VSGLELVGMVTLFRTRANETDKGRCVGIAKNSAHDDRDEDDQ